MLIHFLAITCGLGCCVQPTYLAKGRPTLSSGAMDLPLCSKCCVDLCVRQAQVASLHSQRAQHESMPVGGAGGWAGG